MSEIQVRNEWLKFESNLFFVRGFQKFVQGDGHGTEVSCYDGLLSPDLIWKKFL